MEEFDIREATPKDAEKIIIYLAQVGGETDYLSFGNCLLYTSPSPRD